MADVENVIIIGSGPAGYTAALYTARADLNPLVIEGFLWGGLLQQTTDVENYPGYPKGVMGPEMMQEFRDQAERFGTRFVTDNATKLELGAEGEPHTVWVGDDAYKARAVILAMGAEHKKLGVPGEEELAGRGISYCATCDAAFFKDRHITVVGGGDSAMEEAIFLAKFGSKVTVVHRRDEFRASAIMLDRARAQDNLEFLTPYVDREVRLRRGRQGARDPDAAQHRDRRDARARGGRDVHRDRPRAAVRARAGPGRGRRERLRRHRGQVHAHERGGRVRGRRPGRPHLPPGRHRRRLGLSWPRWTPSGTCATTHWCRRPMRSPRRRPGRGAVGPAARS